MEKCAEGFSESTGSQTHLTKCLIALRALVVPLSIVANSYVFHKICVAQQQFKPFSVHKKSLVSSRDSAAG
jgi:hypothetical protein